MAETIKTFEHGGATYRVKENEGGLYLEEGPEGDYELTDSWSASVGTAGIVLRHEGDTVAHVKHVGWTMDRYVTYTCLPSHITQKLLDLGFEESDEPLHDLD